MTSYAVWVISVTVDRRFTAFLQQLETKFISREFAEFRLSTLESRVAGLEEANFGEKKGRG